MDWSTHTVSNQVDELRDVDLLAIDPALQQHLRSHDTCAEPGWSVCMHADGVQCTTASMVCELSPDGMSVVHALTGSPCERTATTFTVAEAGAGAVDLSVV